MAALAAEIGERNVWAPRALHRARDFIVETWRSQYRSTIHEYEVAGAICPNLEMTLPGVVGRARPDVLAFAR